jgi:hypothetical protein
VFQCFLHPLGVRPHPSRLSDVRTFHFTAVPPFDICPDRPSRSHPKRTGRRGRRHLKVLRATTTQQSRRCREIAARGRRSGTVRSRPGATLLPAPQTSHDFAALAPAQRDRCRTDAATRHRRRRKPAQGEGWCPPACASDLLVATSRDDGEHPDARVLTDGKSDLVRSPHLTGVATNIEPGSCRSHNPRWSRLPHCRLPLCHQLHKLGTPADSLLVRTICGTEPEPGDETSGFPREEQPARAGC